MARVLLLCAVPILISLLVTSVHCQEEGSGGGGSSVWERFAKAVQSFFEDLRGVWNDFKEEVRARTVDIRGWTQEVWDNFKQKMNEWVNQRSDISESEKIDMRNFIERMKMPEDAEDEQRK